MPDRFSGPDTELPQLRPAELTDAPLSLLQFIEKFQEIKEATRHAPATAVAAAASATNGTTSTPTTSANASPVIARAVKMDQVSS